MESTTTIKKSKGGRPKKGVKKDQLLGVRCSPVERKVIEAKSKSANLSVSEYLRELGLTGKIESRHRALPTEVLQYKGTLNHMAANLNQIAKKRNGIDELNALERARLHSLSGEVKQAVQNINNYFK